MVKKTIDFSGGYFEAILQLRPAKQEVLDFINDFMSRTERLKIAKEITLKTGFDLYLTDWRSTLAMAKQIKKQFHCSLLTSRKLHTQDRMSGKKVYRVTVCLRWE